MGSIVSALTNVPKAMALVVKVINCGIYQSPRPLGDFEATYREQLLKADPQIYNEEYFRDVALILKEIQEKISRATWWTSLTLGLLLLLIFRIVDTINFYGTTIDLRKFSPIILLVYSGSRLRIVLMGIVMNIRERLLKAHARIITNDENPSLYQMRYSARPSIFVKFPSSPTFAIRKTIAAKHLLPTVKFLPLILVTFGLFYIIVYLAIVCVIIFTPGTGILIRAILIILSVGLELLAIIIPFFGLFIAVKDPNSGKTFWNKIRSAVNQNIARTGSAAES